MNEKTEYDYIDIIGETHETFKNNTEKLLNQYYHKQEVKTVRNILKSLKLENFYSVIDLGCSIGTWYDDYKRFGFKKVIGIDISKERAEIAKKRGYDNIHVCNAQSLPYLDNSVPCIISNDVFVHILRDEDKLKSFKEISRVLKPDGLFIFNIPNAEGYGFDSDTTNISSRYSIIGTIKNQLKEANLELLDQRPSYFTIPRILAHPRLAKISSKYIYPIIDSILSECGYDKLSKVYYFTCKKSS